MTAGSVTPSLFAPEDERGAVASMLLDASCVPVVTRLVGPRDFGDAVLRVIFEAIVSQYRDTKAINEIAVLHAIRDHPLIDNPQALLAELIEAVTTTAHAKTFAEGVANASLKRRITEVAEAAYKAAQNGEAGTDVLSQLGAEVEDLQRSTEHREPFKKGNLASFVSNYPRQKPPVIDGIIREGETCNLIAASKVGKSWMSYSLALAVANNERWLGRFDVSHGRVLIVDNELHPETLASRLPTVAEAMGIPLNTVDRDIDIWSLRGNLQSLEALGAEFEKIESGEYKLVIFDAFYRFAADGVSENDNAAMTRVYNLLDRYAARLEAAFVVVHHASKGDQAGKAVTDVGAGAGAQSRATDCHLVIRPHEEDGCAVLDAAVRSFAPIQPVVLRWAYPIWIPDDQLDPSKLAGRLGNGQQAKVKEDQSDKQRIADALAEAAEPLSTRKVREATGFGRAKAERLLSALTADGQVESFEGAAGFNRCMLYRLTSNGGGTGGTRVEHPPVESVPGGGVCRPLKGGDPPTLAPGTASVPPSAGHEVEPHPEFAQPSEVVA